MVQVEVVLVHVLKYLWLINKRHCARRDDSGGLFSRYSKWHRLNQEVEKTTKKNKLDKNSLFLFSLTRVFVQHQLVCSGFGLRSSNTVTVSVIRGYCEKAKRHIGSWFITRCDPGRPLLGAHVIYDGLCRVLKRLFIVWRYNTIGYTYTFTELKSREVWAAVANKRGRNVVDNLGIVVLPSRKASDC